MTTLAGAGKRAERAACGARLPSYRAARGAAAVAAAAAAGPASGRDRGSGRAGEGWLRLPKSGWRRVDTIRVRRLFG
ncbi:hypothetical protein ACFOZ0_21710 [Streptomyces yaanensis]|uniref:Uncharacterized protein n=1 Tax=Streptomyces yaanensis TaxID=1142239 RepID=A0ABV7SH41_9ACTN|nr:hypothetical protein [Streptomyces sp. CGMCC 4.7035]WNB97550.1 hypothetical protein Q2K21_05380 [Streptomyces sp. CGMCC 4.7035]